MLLDNNFIFLYCITHFKVVITLILNIEAYQLCLTFLGSTIDSTVNNLNLDEKNATKVSYTSKNEYVDL